MSILSRSRIFRRSVPALLLFGSLLAAGSAPAVEWVEADVDFSRASVRAAALAPSQPTLAFVAGLGGSLYRSTNAGATWDNLSTQVPSSSGWAAIAVSPDDPDLVLGGISGASPNGPAVVLRSVDAGDTWTPTSAGLGGLRPGQLLFDPGNPSRVFAGTSAGTGGGIYRSEDAGLTWSLTTASFGDLGINSLALDPSDPSRLLAGTPDGHLRSTDGGDSWDLTAPGFNFSTISWSASAPSVVYAADGNDAWISTDGGQSFTALPTPTEAYRFEVIAVDPTNEDRVLLSGLAPCDFGLFDTGAVYRSLDGGATWSRVFASEDCSDFVELLFFNPNAPTRVYLAASGPGGFWKSIDAGATWSVKNEGMHMYRTDDLEIDAAGTVYVRSNDLSIRTDDITGTWEQLETPFYTEARAFEASPTVAGLLYESGIGFDIDVGVPYLMASENGGDTWSPPLLDFPNGIAYEEASCLAAAWNSTTVYAFLFDSVYRSDDRNLNYTLVHSGTGFRAAAVDPTDPDRLAAARRFGPVFQLSTDGGMTWTPRSSGLPLDDPVKVEFDPIDPDRIAVVFDDEGAFETLDAGLTWSLILQSPSKTVDADWNPATGFFYLATREDGVVSNDPRITSAGYPSAQASSVVHHDGENVLVAGTAWYGIYYLPLGDPAGVEPSASVSTSLELLAHPNPSNGNVRIDLQIPNDTGRTRGRITVHDATGRQVRTLHEGEVPAIGRTVSWDGRDTGGARVSAGVYWVRYVGEDQERAAVQVTRIR